MFLKGRLNRLKPLLPREISPKRGIKGHSDGTDRRSGLNREQKRSFVIVALQRIMNPWDEREGMTSLHPGLKSVFSEGRGRPSPSGSGSKFSGSHCRFRRVR